MTAPGGSASSRETRLLAATIGISLVVLLVLSRFRFPETAAESRDGTSAQPLARLAARAAFDDLSLAVRELTGRVDGAVLPLRVTMPGIDDGWRLVPALRVRDDVAMALLPDGSFIEAIPGVPGPVTVLGRDAVRGVTLVRVPARKAPVLTLREGQQPLTTPGYVAVAEASASGTSLRPVFVGRSDGLGDPRWDGQLLSLGRGASGDEGAPVFTLDGRLVGLVTIADREPAVVPASPLLALVDPLLRGATSPPGDIGVTVQDLDARLAAATGVQAGAAVVTVRPDGPAAGRLVPGDVITTVNGQPMRHGSALQQRIARSAPGTALSLAVRRDGAFLTVPVTVGSRPPAPQSPVRAAADTSSRPLGLALRAVEGRGSEITRVQDDSAGAAGDLAPGDVVIAIGATRAPSPAAVTRAFEAVPPGGALLLTIEHDGQPRLVAVPR
ncbi:PDZ domain-containing protein [Luteitalea sp.]|jgi:serine protease Do|uniref:PDZ domain-containing protein n=1 Tax=Luteitalea sp. TaxID=2004800 RepID=UPI0037CB6FDD